MMMDSRIQKMIFLLWACAVSGTATAQTTESKTLLTGSRADAWMDKARSRIEEVLASDTELPAATVVISPETFTDTLYQYDWILLGENSYHPDTWSEILESDFNDLEVMRIGKDNKVYPIHALRSAGPEPGSVKVSSDAKPFNLNADGDYIRLEYQDGTTITILHYEKGVILADYTSRNSISGKKLPTVVRIALVAVPKAGSGF